MIRIGVDIGGTFTDFALVGAGDGMRLHKQQHTGWFEPMPVLHDRRLPQWNRMLLPLDFLPVNSPPRALDPRSS